jgi:hypothetical protein
MAQDEDGLRRQLRARGIPVGDRGPARQVAEAYGLVRRRGGLAMDSRLPPRLSFDALYPGLRARLGGSKVFAIAVESERERGRSRSGSMAYDSAANASNAASFDGMWPGLRRHVCDLQ